MVIDNTVLCLFCAASNHAKSDAAIPVHQTIVSFSFV